MLNSRQSHQQPKGFSLIELLVTIAIIGTLAALLITNLVGARTRAADVMKKGDLQQLKAALRLYYNDTQNYPLGSGVMEVSGTAIDPGEAFTVGTTVYMKQTPADYAYYVNGSNTDEFLLTTELGNASDSELQGNYAKCCSGMSHTGCPASDSIGTTLVMCED